MPYCYLIRAGANGPVKIGFAIDVQERISTLQSGCWEDLILLRTWHGDRTAEAWLHKNFKHLRIAREWFTFDESMLTVAIPSQKPRLAMDVQALIEKAGGEAQFQTLCRVARTTVLDWKRTGFIPANRVAQISCALDIPLAEVIKLSPPPKVRASAAAEAV